jgi:predicted transcriptional regulator
MPKRSYKDVERLMNEAFKLLDSGLSKQQVAEKLGTTIRTVHRWVKDGKYKPISEKLQLDLLESIVNQKVQEVVLETVVTQKVQEPVLETIIKSVENNPDLPFSDIENYIESQRLFAMSSGTIAVKFLPILDNAISRLQADDITPRTLSSLIRGCVELIEISSTCYTRATGLKEVLNAIQICQELE